VTLARTLLKLWRLRLWLLVGVLLAGVAAVGTVATSHSTVYASASTQLLVDSPDSALANASIDLTGYLNRADAFARMMTSDAALQYIGKAAGINGSEIDATGPIEINGLPAVTHAPVAIVNGQDVAAPAIYKLSFVQNPSLPTIDVYADAPTTKEAIALANGAVTGFASFISQLNANNVPQSERIDIRQLGQATGGMVDASASKSMALLVFVAVFALWCGIVLFASRLRANLRAARQGDVEPFAVPTDSLPRFPSPGIADDLPRFAPAADAHDADSVTNGAVNRRLSHRAWASSRIQSRP
jgi:hypothetical protein